MQRTLRTLARLTPSRLESFWFCADDPCIRDRAPVLRREVVEIDMLTTPKSSWSGMNQACLPASSCQIRTFHAGMPDGSCFVLKTSLALCSPPPMTICARKLTGKHDEGRGISDGIRAGLSIHARQTLVRSGICRCNLRASSSRVMFINEGSSQGAPVSVAYRSHQKPIGGYIQLSPASRR